MNNVVRASSLKANPNPVDPDVVVPQAVKRAAAAATAAQAAAYPDQTSEPAPAAPPSNADTITIAEPTAAVAPASSATVTPPGNPEPPAPAPAPVPDETWEHKFRSAEGRRLRLETLLQQATDRLTALDSQVQELRDARTAAPVAPAPTPERLVSEQEANEFGPEMLDVMGRRAREIISPELSELRASVAALEGKLTGTATAVKRNARAELYSQMDSRLPAWREINELDDFKAWLALPDPYFGDTRNSALQKAFEQNDTPRVLNFFKGFVSELAATTPADPSVLEPPAPQPAKPSLETLAAPGRARTPAQQDTPAEKRIITTADINAFYAAKARGDYNGRETEFTQLEQELFRAQREGRVRAV